MDTGENTHHFNRLQVSPVPAPQATIVLWGAMISAAFVETVWYALSIIFHMYMYTITTCELLGDIAGWILLPAMFIVWFQLSNK